MTQAVRLGAGLSEWRTVSTPRPVHVGNVVDEVAVKQFFFSEYFDFTNAPSSYIIHLSPTLYTLSNSERLRSDSYPAPL